MSVAQALLSQLIDYAGLFPPASLEMEPAVRNYQQYLAGPSSWMLGNFIVPAARLAEFSQIFQAVCCEELENPWMLSVVCAGDNMPVDLKTIRDFPQGAAFLSTLEIKATDLRTTRSVLEALPRGPARYVEVAPDPTQMQKLLPLLASSSARAKLRTGGLAAAAIPPPEAVARFLSECAQQRIPFKATAGLHHPVRSVHALTYQMGSTESMMHGFLNVFLAASLAYYGSTEEALLPTLNEEDPKAFRLEDDDDVIAWHDHRMTSDQIDRARKEFAISFGSCSFIEPIDDLKAMEWL
jgi:hypothetical protein